MIADRFTSEAQSKAFAELASLPVEKGTKGFPPQALPLPLGEISSRGWNLLQDDVTFPVAVLRLSALRNNGAAMRDYLSARQMTIAPHGKTTMAPQLFALQMADGAWGITISTVQHLAVCRRFAFERILIANQIVAHAEIAYLFDELHRSPGLDLYVLVDSVQAVERLAKGASRHNNAARLNCLVEMGSEGGRAGCRTIADALRVVRAIQKSGLSLRGVEGFEGILSDVASVDAFLDLMCETADAVAQAGLFAPDLPIILTAGGSAYYDRVATRLRASPALNGRTKILSRSGCYLTHDSGSYEQAFAQLRARDPASAPKTFQPALAVFAIVQSRPEPRKAIVSMGRRDAGFDAGLPIPEMVFRTGRDARPVPIAAGHRISALNDQHGHLELPAGSDLAVGDVVGFGVSHPCTTFDKWQVLMVIDDDYRIVDAVRTFF